MISRFLLTDSQLNYVLDKFEPREMEQALQSLPVTLDDAYGDMMGRIEAREKGVMRQALKTLLWILNAARPLTLEEVSELVIVQEGDSEIQDCHRLYPQSVIDACESLVDNSWNPGGYLIVRFTHFTVQEFLRKYDFTKCLRPMPSLAMTCITYLGFISLLSSMSRRHELE